MEEKKNLCAPIPLSLHQRLRAEQEQRGQTLADYITDMPDTPGLAVWKSGHIGVYIGNGEVIEAMDTRYGVVKTKLQGRGWTHWLEVPGIKYD